jgi:signal transduction histidine kinase/ActR/RegA family two-component response regulator
LIDILETLPDLDAMPILHQPAKQNDKDGGGITYIASFIYAPVYVDKKLVGILLATSSRIDAFGPDEDRLLTTLANQTASAVSHLSEILASQQKQLESVASLLVENIEVGTLLFDADFHLLVANPLGRKLLQDLNPDQADRPLIRLGSCSLQELINQQDEHLETEIVLNENPRRVFSARLRPVENRQWVMTLREVTRERELQARQQSQERLASVGQLAAGIAHDFNNIMAAIMVYTELLRSDTSVPSKAQEKLQVIKQQVDRATSLIRQILDYSRQSVMDQIHLNLLTFIKELEKLLDRVMPETIRIELNYQPGNFWINADPTRLQLAFMNLAVNARDAMPEGGTIRFDLEQIQLLAGRQPMFMDMPPGDWIRISVCDTGQGIAPDVRQHIFEPFFSTKPVGQGTGLGLAQVYGIIKKHGGYIDVQSQVGEGTTFIIYLPAIADPSLLKMRATAQPLPKKVLQGDQQTVLIVEDDIATRGALQALLEAYNFQVMVASNGQEGIQKYQAAAEAVALVVCDVVMPQLGGLELYQRLKASYPTIKVLFITGHPLDSDGLALLSDYSRGQVRWLQKPFSVQDFYQAVQALLPL